LNKEIYLTQQNRLGQVEHPDYHQLKDKSGKFRQCYYCRETALKKPMISCDYCPLYWHLDCLKLASPPNPAKKWRCPTHFENIIVSFVRVRVLGLVGREWLIFVVSIETAERAKKSNNTSTSTSKNNNQ
jgi:hypothetical protein